MILVEHDLEKRKSPYYPGQRANDWMDGVRTTTIRKIVFVGKVNG